MAGEALREYAPEHTTAWCLLLLLSMSKAGLSPASNSVFHKLIYFANTLARLYRLQPPAEVVMRHPRGPFYPRAQGDLDRLCAMGLVSVASYRIEQGQGATRRAGIYDITDRGFELANRLIAEVHWAHSGCALLLDLCTAFTSVSADFIDSAVQYDLTYRAPTIETHALIQFRDYQRNLSLRATHSLESRVPVALRPIPQQAMKIYIRYLERLAA